MNNALIKNIRTMLQEKEISLDRELQLDGHFGLEINDLLNFISGMPRGIIKKIHATFVQIDFRNGDVMDYINFLAKGMIKSLGY